MLEYFSALTLQSQNKKTRPIPVSTTSRLTCPKSCSLQGDQGCYAEAGYYTRIYWDKVTEGKAGNTPLEFIKKVAALPMRQMFRHNVAGDLWPDQTYPERIDVSLLQKLVRTTNHLYAAWTYTHHTLDGEHGVSNAAVIKYATNNKFVINLSTESLDVAAKRHKEGFQVTVVQPEGLPTAFRHNGVQFVQCPATLPDSTVNCSTCGGRMRKPLCATERSVVVIFPAHGQKKVAAASHCS